MWDLCLVAFFIVICSGASSMMEVAFLTVSESKVNLWRKKGVRFSHSLFSVKQNIRDTITTLVILNNITNIGGSMLLGNMAFYVLDSWFVGVFTACFTSMVIIFAELIPKILGERFADVVSLRTAPFLLLLFRLFRPFLFCSKIMLRPLEGRIEHNFSLEEIQVLLQMGRRRGNLDGKEMSMIYRTLLSRNVPVKHVMTPRTRIVSFSEDVTLEYARKVAKDSPFSKFPVYGETLDDIVGVVEEVSILRALYFKNGNATVRSIVRDCLFVPENKPILRLLDELRKMRLHVCIVMDEYGGTSGLITLEDILEEIVGEISGLEDDLLDNMHVVSSNEIIVPGSMPMNQVLDFFSSDVPCPYSTVSKFVLENLQNFPSKKESFVYGEWFVIVEEATEKTIEKVRIRKREKKV